MFPRCIFGCIALMVFNCCYAQTVDTSFMLLWYKGKKINDSTLLTPNGQTVSYSPSKNSANVSTPPKNDIFNNVKKAIDNNEQFKTEIDRRILQSQHGTLLTGFILQVNRAIDQVAANAEKIAQTTVQLTDEKLSRPPPEAFEGSSIPGYLQQYYLDALAMATAIRKNPFPPDPPPPPSKDPDYCFPCDAQRHAAYRKDSAAFMDFMKEENIALQKAFAVIGYFYFRKTKHLPYDTVRSVTMEADMRDAMPVLFRQIGRKLWMAWNQYSGDATKVEFLFEVCIQHIRRQQLTGLPAFPGFPELHAMMQRCVDVAQKFFAEAVKKRDYRVLLNVSWVYSLFRGPQLYGMEQKEMDFDVMQLININKFNVTVHAHGHMRNDQADMSATMHGESVFGAAPDSNCLLKWVLLEPDTSKMFYKLEDAAMQASGRTVTYTGTRNWKSYPADLRLDFCRDDKDTAILFGYSPLDGQESWKFEGQDAGPAAIINYIFTLGFMDIKRLQAMASDPTLQARMHSEMMAKYKEFSSSYQGNKDPSKMTPQEIQQMHRAMSSARDMKNIVHPMLPTSFLCKGRLVNGEKLVFDGKLNGKELFPENKSIEEAILTVKIEHRADTGN